MYTDERPGKGLIRCYATLDHDLNLGQRIFNP